MTQGRRIVASRVAIATATSTVASTAASRAFDGELPAWHLPLITACAGVSWLVAARRRAWIRYPAAAAVIAACALAQAGLLGGAVPADAWAGMASGLGELLSTSWPTPTSPTAVVPLAAACGAACILSADLAVRGRGVAALAGPLAILVTAGLAAAPAGPPSVLVVVGVAAGGAAILAATTAAPATTARTVAAAGVVAALAASSVVFELDPRFDPRQAPTTDTEAIAITSPLEQVAAWQAMEPRLEIFRSDLETPATWTLVHLDTYDGLSWSAGDDFRAVGEGGSVGEGRGREVAIALTALTDPWLPVTGTVRDVDARVATDESGSSFLLLDEPTAGVPVRIVTELDDEPLTAPDGAESPASASASVVPIPGSIGDLASAITTNARSDVERARRLANHLAEEYSLDPTAPPGHSLPLLDAFLTRTGRGTEEQFVAGFAVLASTLGLPVRIAIGVRTTEADDGTVGWSDAARSWPEVEFDEIGWVAFDPVPDSTGTGDTDRGAGAVAPIEDDRAAPPTIPPPEPESQPEQDRTETPTTEDTAPLPVTVVIPALVIALIAGSAACYIVVVIVFKRLRRRRRGAAATPTSLALGAFATARDLAIDLGARPSRALTDQEFAVVSGEVLNGAERLLAAMAKQSTAAVYAPSEVTIERAERAWASLIEFESVTVQRVGRVRYLRSLLSLRSIRRPARDLRRRRAPARGRGRGASS
jgi:transglutaminase-like putative cysteine protease